MKIYSSLCVIISVSLLFIYGCVPISKEAEKKFLQRTGPFSVTVFPVNIVTRDSTEHDTILAKRIIEFLKNEKLADGILADKPAEFNFERSPNQAKMASNSGRAFIEIIKSKKLDTDYALLVDILWFGRNVYGVHFYLTDRDGRIASFGLTNSHWEEFKKVNPIGRSDGCTIAELMMKRLWGGVSYKD